MKVKNFKLLVMFILALFLANTVSATLSDLNPLHQPADTQDSMVWTVLPNESLGQLAASFYPGNKLMHQKFIQKTRRLNKEMLSENAKYKTPTAITIPSLKGLSAQASDIKLVNKQSDSEPLQLGYDIKPVGVKKEFTLNKVSEQLVNKYKDLLERNAFLKEAIKKLNQRLAFLGSKLAQLKVTWNKTLTPPPKKKLKNLGTQTEPTKPLQNGLQKTPDAPSQDDNKIQENNFVDVSNKWLWLGLVLFGQIGRASCRERV